MPHSFLVKKKDFKKALAVQFADRVFPHVATSYLPLTQDVPQFTIPSPFPAFSYSRGTPIPMIRETIPLVKEPVAKFETGPKNEGIHTEKPGSRSESSKCPSRSIHRHMLIHSGGQKPYKCQECPKVFAIAARLKIHNRIHTGEKPYTCNICQRGFAQLTNLQRHILTHTGQKPHKCTYCPKAFVSSSDLQRHICIHTGERPYKCKQCTKAFTTSGNLQSHILTHTGEKPYQCKICNWKFNSSSNLRKHMRIQHAVNASQRDLVSNKSKKTVTKPAEGATEL